MSIFPINSSSTSSGISRASNISIEQSQLQDFASTPNNVQDAIFEHSMSGAFGLYFRPGLNLNANWTNYSGTNVSYRDTKYLSYLKQNRLVDIRGLVRKNSPGIFDEIIATLPPSCTPDQALISFGWSWDGINNASPGYITINNDGTIRYGSGDGRGFLSIAQTFFISQPTYTWIGDNIASAIGSVTPSQRFSSIVSNNMGVKEDNLTIPGISMQSSGGVTPAYPVASTPSIVETLYNYLIRFPEKIFIQIGTNDINYDGIPFTALNFQTALDYAVSYFIEYGIRPRNIYILTPPYHPIAGYQIGAPFNSGSVAKHLDYITATKAVAKHKGCCWVDTYTPLKNAGDSYFQDSINPNANGHQLIARVVTTALQNSNSAYSF